MSSSVSSGRTTAAPAFLVEDRFSEFDPTRWSVEAERPDSTRVQVADGRLWLDTPAGLTVWLRQRLEGAYRIRFRRQVLVEGQRNDRLSDLNLFWGAHEPGQGVRLPRDGVLASYDSLATWYLGLGGNDNRTTRFRRYDGSAERPLLGERLDAEYLLRAGHDYCITLEVTASATRVWVDDALWFEQALDGLPAPGWFGLRTVWSRQAVADFTVQAL